MIELRGKANMAKVFTDYVDSETIGQIITLLNQDFVASSKIRIMPDCHAGAGCVIGTTMTLHDKVVPNLVGVDIGCGMYALKISETEIDLEKLDSIISNYVPCGFQIRDEAIVTSNIARIKAPIDRSNAYRSLGTLGGGNHFIEVDRDSSGNLWLVIHTGSRHLGLEVCKHYQNLGSKKLSAGDTPRQIAATIAKLKAAGQQGKIENTIQAMKRTTASIPKDLCYVEGEDFSNYIHDMELTQEYAAINRETIARVIVGHMDLEVVDAFQTIHNYIDKHNMILRKGAVSAQSGERLIIPMNMRDGSLICVGKGNPDWNYSAPHGAGRLVSRSQARSVVSLDEFTTTMQGIYSSSVVASTLDEAPQVYKPMEEIVKNVEDTVDIVEVIKPIYNFKAH